MVTSTIGGTSPDYTTITGWASDSRSSGDIGECRNAAFSGNVAITVANLTLRAESGAKHTGTLGTGARTTGTTGNSFTITASGFVCEDMEIISGSNTSNEAFRLGTSGAGAFTLRRCLLDQHASQSGGQGDAIYTSTSGWTINIDNCHFGSRWDRANVARNSNDQTDVNAQHITAISGNCKYIFDIDDSGSGSTVTCDGCALGPFTDNGFQSTATYTLTDCIIADTAPTGTNVTTSATFTTSTAASAFICTNISDGSNDFALTDHANNLGLDYVPSSRHLLDDDYLDTARASGDDNDCGCFETAAAGTTINQVAADTLTLTEFNATVSYDVTVNQVSAGSLSFAGFTPHLISRTIHQSNLAAQLGLTANAGTVTYDVTIAQVATATLAFTANAGTVSYDITVSQVATATLTFAGFTPHLISKTFHQTAAATLTFTPLNGTVEFGGATVINQVAAGTLTFTPLNGTVSYDFTISQVAAGSLTLAVFAATVTRTFNQTAAGTLTFSPLAATVTFGGATTINQVAAGTLTFAAFAATITRTFNQTAAGTLTFSVFAATLTRTFSQTAAGSLTLTGNNGTVTYDVTIAQVAAGTLTFSPINGAVTVGGGTSIMQTASPVLALTANNGTTSYSFTIEQTEPSSFLGSDATLKFTTYPATLNPVWANWGFLVDNMTWEGGKILKDIARMTAPPGSPATHFFWHAFYTKPNAGGPTGDARSVRTIARFTDGQNWIDFWFFHYWGDTSSSRTVWDKATPPESIHIITVPFFAWGEGRPVRVANWFAHGHAMVDRIRLTLTGYATGSIGKVTNTTKAGALLPFYAHPAAHASMTSKPVTLQNTINEMAGRVTGVDREQFRQNPWRSAFPGQTGDQESFGINHLGVDVWAGGDEREESWWMVLRKHLNSPANWVHPVSGALVDFTSAAYNNLVVDSHGISYGTGGWDNNPSNGQNWYNPKGANPNSIFDWQTHDPVDGSNGRWQTFVRHHWGINHVCQYYDRHKDPGMYQVILHLQETWLGNHPNQARGAFHHTVGSGRSRGRGYQAAACPLHGDG